MEEAIAELLVPSVVLDPAYSYLALPALFAKAIFLVARPRNGFTRSKKRVGVEKASIEEESTFETIRLHGYFTGRVVSLTV